MPSNAEVLFSDVADRLAANLSILFPQTPVVERPALAKAAGFDAVELWWPFAAAEPSDAKIDELVAAIAAAQVQLVALNFFAGDMPSGDRGVLSHPDRSAEFRANVGAVVEIGSRLGCRRFNALYGNRIDSSTPATQDETALENLAYAAGAVRTIGGVVLLEPVSGAARYPLRTAADVVRVLDELREGPAVALLADLYHLAVNGDGVDEVISCQAPRIGHVQVADAPGRHEPGTGSLPLTRYLTRLSEAGYDGWIGLEYAPSDPQSPDFGWLGRTPTTEMSSV